MIEMSHQETSEGQVPTPEQLVRLSRKGKKPLSVEQVRKMKNLKACNVEVLNARVEQKAIRKKVLREMERFG